MKRKFQNWRKTETGQSLVEFAIILPILVLLMTLPVDFFRYINTKMILSSAASESIGQLNYSHVSSGSDNAKTEIKKKINEYYGDRLKSSEVKIHFDKGPLDTKEYQYYVYTSDKAGEDKYQKRFDDRDSSYQCMEIEVGFTYELSPITYWGVLFLGDKFDVKTPTYKRKVYVSGYKPK